jgi:hypothetical protein
MGFALLLSGAGFLVLTLRVLRPEAVKPRSTREIAASEAALQS